MKIVIEIKDPVFENINVESTGTEFSFTENLRKNLSEILCCDVKVEDASEKVILPMEYFLKGVNFHAVAEARGVKLAEESKANNEHEKIIRMHEDGATKQRGFKEAYLEIISKAKGTFETVESLVKEYGDLTGIW